MPSGEVEYLSARLERLHAAGLSGSLALAAAEECAIAIHDLEELVAAGADPVTALRIVWPLEETTLPAEEREVERALVHGLHDHGDQSRPEATK